MKKIISLLLILSFVLTVLACCTEKDQKNPSDSSGTSQTGTQDGYKANVPAVDYKGATFILMGRSRDAAWGEMGLFSDGYDSTTMNDAVYNRNSKVEAACNIKLEQIEVYDTLTSSGVFYKMLAENAASGDYIADICCAGLIDACSLISQNIFVDLQTVPYVDLNAPWWQQRINESVRILNKQYFGFNDMMLNDKCDTYLLYFNKTVFDDNQLEYPYQHVYDGTWTNEKLLEYIMGYGQDMNGNGYCDPEDKIGFTYLLNDTFFVGAGITGAALDEDGYPYMLDFTQKTSDVYDVITTVVKGGVYNSYNFGDLDTARACFDEKGLFMNFHMLHMQEVAAYYESDVGIVPCPKYDETQKDYYSRAGYNGATAVTILTSTENLERAGIVLEIFGAESKNYISPAFYEKLFTDRYTNDEESKDMLSIVINSEIIDLDQVFKWGEIIVAASSAAGRGGSAATLYSRILKSAQVKVDATIENYFDIQ